MNNIEAFRELVQPLADSLNLSIWGIETLGTGRSTIRVFVESKQKQQVENSEDNHENHEFDSQAGVNIDQCAHLSRLIAINLDAEDFFDFAYILEVSSPGLERTFFELSQLTNYLACDLEFSLEEALDDLPNRKRYLAKLIALKIEENSFCVLFEGQELEIPWEQVKKIKLVHTFPENNKKILNVKK